MIAESTRSSITIRSYQPSDLSACQKIFTASHLSYDNPMVYINMALQTDMADIEKNYLEVPDGHWWIALSDDDNRVVGHVAGQPLSIGDSSYYAKLPEGEREEIYELRRMAVDLDAQRAGVGSQLLATVIDFARAKGYRQVHLTTLSSMMKACAFYEKNGFTRGILEKTLFDFDVPKTLEELKEMISKLPKPIVFEPDAVIPEEDQRLRRISPTQSKRIYVQHYFLNL